MALILAADSSNVWKNCRSTGLACRGSGIFGLLLTMATRLPGLNLQHGVTCFAAESKDTAAAAVAVTTKPPVAVPRHGHPGVTAEVLMAFNKRKTTKQPNKTATNSADTGVSSS